MRHLWVAVCLGTAALSLPACSQLLAGGLVAGQALLISDDQEVQIGQSAAQQVLSDPKTPPYTHAQVDAYVTSIGQTVAAHCDRSNLPYQFHVIVSDELNAFALPGGQIFVTTSALRAMKNEAELAGVLGHEITHVAHKHGVETLRKTMVAQGIATAAFGSTPQLVQQAAQIALGLVLKGYSRANEDEADHYGAVFSNAAGYDPHGLVSFLQTIAQTMGDTPAVLEPLSDHPAISERTAKINAEIASAGLTQTTTNAAAFLSATGPLR